MRYLLYEYAESPKFASELPEIQYDYKKNLNVLKSNFKPAISFIDNLGTETFTKTYNEGSDSDAEESFLLATESMTLVNNEGSDPDKENFMDSLITMTNTQYQIENTDTD